jgi:hypothetical protein
MIPGRFPIHVGSCHEHNAPDSGGLEPMEAIQLDRSERRVR